VRHRWSNDCLRSEPRSGRICGGLREWAGLHSQTTTRYPDPAALSAPCVCLAGRPQKTRISTPVGLIRGIPAWMAAWSILNCGIGGLISMILLYLLAAYVAVGIAVAVAFVTVGVAQVQPMPVTVGARILLLPGAFVLWPLVVARWHKSRGGR
jgi:hypothetical protein